MKLVLDTNVCVSGTFFSGPPAQIVSGHQGIDVVKPREFTDNVLQI